MEYDELFAEIINSGENFLHSLHQIKTPLEPKYKRVLIGGMGGSGISGDYLKSINNNPQIEVIVNKDYEFESLRAGDFVLLVSYSGNTEETLSMANQVIKAKMPSCMVSSGGKLKSIAKQNQIPHYSLPGGKQPRAAFPYIFGTLFGITKNNLNLSDFSEEEKLYIISSSKILQNTQDLDKIDYQLILNNIPIIISAKELDCVSNRFRCQLNENAKLVAFNFIVPEFSHNAIVGIDGKVGKTQFFILLKSNQTKTRATIHLDYLENDLDGNIAGSMIVKSNQSNFIIEKLELTWKLDYLSVVLAKVQNIDAFSVKSIDKLKEKLADNSTFRT
ncbi:MAG: hypothetical protein INQ03_07355 [Candidatus Heimdallarchaeota archaeon]|nr:hypothetical protein [Candidatus Heimdallarchaeota archaeon]